MNIDMHATTEQLLEIKDGLSNGVSLHVESCERCQQELFALQMLNEQLFVAADQEPRAELWDRIVESVETGQLQDNCLDDADTKVNASANYGSSQGANQINAPEPTGSFPHTEVPVELLAANTAQLANPQSLSRAVYSLAASILVTGFIGLYIFGQQGSSNQQAQQLQANIQELMLNSRGMEVALQQVALQNELLTSSERSTAERLYYRLTYVDQMIHENNSNSESNPQRIESLWNARIATLNELNSLYYQRQQTLDDSEI